MCPSAELGSVASFEFTILFIFTVQLHLILALFRFSLSFSLCED